MKECMFKDDRDRACGYVAESVCDKTKPSKAYYRQTRNGPHYIGHFFPSKESDPPLCYYHKKVTTMLMEPHTYKHNKRLFAERREFERKREIERAIRAQATVA